MDSTIITALVYHYLLSSQVSEVDSVSSTVNPLSTLPPGQRFAFSGHSIMGFAELGHGLGNESSLGAGMQSLHGQMPSQSHNRQPSGPGALYGGTPLNISRGSPGSSLRAMPTSTLNPAFFGNTFSL